ncbi:MAG: alcohol dehydrogenase catalytic domain-containing protein [Actinobacteria bacterium]|nr:alcohol dehydrogenase catalytic domain-containing protein [Actinomycetota bacterium]
MRAAAHGEWPVKPEPPSIPGHEGVGIIERVGPGNPHGLEQGMRVALPWLGYVNEAIAEVPDGSAPEPRLAFDLQVLAAGSPVSAAAGAGAAA